MKLKCGETSGQQNTSIPMCRFTFTMCQEPKTQDMIHDKFVCCRR